MAMTAPATRFAGQWVYKKDSHCENQYGIG